MQPIIPPIDKQLLKEELTPERRLRTTNKAGNEIYIITYQQAPHVMREIGRLREIAFRAAGGGTGMELDWDEFDTCEHPYYQLIVWDPEEELILGGYRFLPGCEAKYDEKRFFKSMYASILPFMLEYSFIYSLFWMFSLF